MLPEGIFWARVLSVSQCEKKFERRELAEMELVAFPADSKSGEEERSFLSSRYTAFRVVSWGRPCLPNPPSSNLAEECGILKTRSKPMHSPPRL